MSTFLGVVYRDDGTGIKVPMVRKCDGTKNGNPCECTMYIKDINGRIICSNCYKEVTDEM